MIVHEGGSWCLYSKDGKKKLGSFTSEAAAKKREAEILAMEHAHGDSVQRYDAGELLPATRMPNGWLRVDARLTRTGVFTYLQPDGSRFAELRTPEEVFSPEALQSFALVPVTDEHPPEFLDAENTRTWARGAAGEAPRRDGDFVRAPLLVTDAELIAKLEGNEARQVSLGYTCDLEHTAGVTPDGQRYDAIQRRIRGNHVAVVPRGRAGAEVRVRMDSAAALDVRLGPVVRIDTSGGAKPGKAPTTKGAPLMLKIDGIDYDVSTPAGQAAAAQALAKLEAKRDAEAKSLEAKADAAVKKADGLQAKLDEATETVKKKDAEIAALPAKLTSQAKARVELEARARKVLGAKAKLDADDKAVRLAVLAKLSPSVDFTKKSDAYLEARFDAAIEAFDESDESDERADQDRAARAGEAPPENSDEHEDTDEPDASKAHEKLRNDGLEAWKVTAKRLGIEA